MRSHWCITLCQFPVYTFVFLLLDTLYSASTKNLVSIPHRMVDPLYPRCPPLTPSSLVTTTLFSVTTCLFLFGLLCSFIFGFSLFAVYIQCMSVIIRYLTFSAWPISLSIVPSRPIHVVPNGKISSFLWLSCIPLYVLPHRLYPFIH